MVNVKKSCVALVCLGLSLTLNVKGQNARLPYHPEPAELLSNYQRALMLDTAVSKNIYNTSLTPHWKPDGKSFWYVKSSADKKEEIFEVNVATGVKSKIFDRPQLTNPLNRQRNRSYSRRSDSAAYRSPDSKWFISLRNNNLFLVDNANKSSRQLTTDGDKELPYGAVTWSPDSKYFVFYKTKIIVPKSVYKVSSSVSNTTRGELTTLPYLQPGDENSSYEMYIGNPYAQTKHAVKVDLPKIDFNGVPELHFNKDNQTFLFNRPDRGVQRYQIIEVNAEKGTSRSVIDEKTDTFIFLWRVFTKYLPKSDEIIYSSERSGYRHLYLINTKTNQIKPVTRGNWVVKGIDSIDIVKREIWFNACGVNAGEDPYNVHYYRIGFDGKKLVSLTPEAGNHKVNYSPDYKYFTDSYSQVNIPPVHELRRSSDGGKISDLEQADVGYLSKHNVRKAEPFVAKGRDGKTNIYGIVCLPSDLDSTRSYPIVEYIYAGPHDSFVPKNFVAYGEMQSLANLGFVVVQMDGMGTANRSKAFHDVCWKNLADSGFPDRILWIKAMAKKYAFADTSRVGIFGTSAGGQSALGALLFHPEFYNAAVSACGCHDNRVDKQIWNEQWMGYPVGAHYDQQSNVTNAYKLKGALLLVVGELDSNVPPESTYRVANELIKAKKTFDLLTIPGAGHTDGGVYGHRKSRDFFITHLLKTLPPDWNNF
ncbi:S9 family peptidase [Pedobacter frigoris]|uniref:S9 family peptidase n=1 Tax=Pedobacter frigoris TaxID=2571272 RepID=A0A4U1CSQ3_9SPHI|nr:S9 family peptidase [Pedobacter frigoris]TKC08959.1 S9 family peptidase [Pedobacter frigoris]